MQSVNSPLVVEVFEIYLPLCQQIVSTSQFFFRNDTLIKESDAADKQGMAGVYPRRSLCPLGLSGNGRGIPPTIPMSARTVREWQGYTPDDPSVLFFT